MAVNILTLIHSSTDFSERELQCYKELYHADYFTYRGKVASHCPGTLQWVLQHTYYKRWMQLEDADNLQLLWISGNPGCGKTVLPKFLLDHIEASVRGRRASQRQPILYFFLTTRKKNKNPLYHSSEPCYTR
jgi:Cdc6-like AAA superfamily ATPase